MEQLLAVVQQRRAFTVTYRRLKRQQQWLVELDRLLDPPEPNGHPRASRRSIKRQVKQFLSDLEQSTQHSPEDAQVVAHICATFRQRWPRLFACYAWPERYRTNNALETFFGRLRTRQRQIHGRKSVHEFILRYGEWVVFVDPTETFAQVLHRFQLFDQTAFDQEFARFQKAQERIRWVYRFRHYPRRCLKQVERLWEEALRHKP